MIRCSVPFNLVRIRSGSFVLKNKSKNIDMIGRRYVAIPNAKQCFVHPIHIEIGTIGVTNHVGVVKMQVCNVSVHNRPSATQNVFKYHHIET